MSERGAEPAQTPALQAFGEGIEQIAERDAGHERQKDAGEFVQHIDRNGENGTQIRQGDAESSRAAAPVPIGILLDHHANIWVSHRRK